ncbi:hypothetical protein CDEST_00788 [Colletotrichum destructivum]|uniref:Uncharacterized protein n=1 Tax=Colletotrichum destructivum TaxID=34406 RepID=A0AAX4HYI3_9PEZI|nr:hypothetical protein CDEST_00788 [Colletotrichum destructivum]
MAVTRSHSRVDYAIHAAEAVHNARGVDKQVDPAPKLRQPALPTRHLVARRRTNRAMNKSWNPPNKLNKITHPKETIARIHAVLAGPGISDIGLMEMEPAPINSIL